MAVSIRKLLQMRLRNASFVSQATKNTTDGFFGAQTILRFIDNFWEKMVDYSFKCQYWVLTYLIINDTNIFEKQKYLNVDISY